MKVTRLLMVMLLAVLSCLLIVSVPILADGGDEDPWDADGGTGGEGDDGSTGSDDGDHNGGEGYLLESFNDPFGLGQNSLMGLMFTISYDIANYFFGSQSDGSTTALASDREMKRDVTLSRQYNVSQAR